MPQVKWYYVNASLDKVGPMTLQALQSLAANGVISRQTTLLTEDGSSMRQAGSIPGLFPEQAPTAPATVAPTIPPPLPQPPPAVTNVFPPATQASPFPPTSEPTWNLPTASTPWDFDAAYSANRQSAPSSFPQAAPYSVPQSNGIPTSWIVFASVLAAMFVFGFLAILFGPRIVRSMWESTSPAQTARSTSSDSRMKTKLSGSSIPMSIFDEAAPPAPPPLPGGSAEKKSLSGSRLPGMGKPLLNKDIDRDIWGTVATSADVSSSSTLPREPIASPRRPESRGARNTEEIVAEVEEAVALIRGKNSSGTGFVVLPGIIATNSHVIDSEEIKDLSVHFPSETGAKKGPFTAQLLYEDPKRDLAFLEIPSKDHLPLSIIRDYNFRRGQKVIVVGNPGRGDGAVLENAVTEGILSTQTEMDDLPFYQLSIAINSGNSGGPVFNDEGDVLGVVTLKSAKAEAMAYCIPPDALNEAIEAVQNRNPADLQKVREQHASLVYLNRGLERLQVLSEVPAGKVPLFAREAIRDLDEAVHRLPDNAIAYFARALFKAVTDDMDGALADLDKAVDLAPDKPEIRELRDLARNERNRRNQMPSGQLISRYQVTMVTPDGRRVMPTPRVPMPRMPTPPTLQMPTTMPQLPPMLPPPGGVRPRGMSPSERALGRDRYQQVVNKELWTFNGTPLRGKLVGYKEGIAQFKLSDAAESGKPVERYANRFSHEDIEDIRFYARYHGIPIGNLQKR